MHNIIEKCTDYTSYTDFLLKQETKQCDYCFDPVLVVKTLKLKVTKIK